MPELPLDFDFLGESEITRDGSKSPDRDDVLDFLSPPLAHAVELIGPISAVLSVTTDAIDTDFAVKLVKIARDGTTLDLRVGIQRLRYRSGYEREDWAQPGELSTLTIDMWATGILLEAGERLRVEVSSIVYPTFARNLNTGEPDSTSTRMVVAHQTVYHDAARPSYVLLPVIPRNLGPLQFEAPK